MSKILITKNVMDKHWDYPVGTYIFFNYSTTYYNIIENPKKSN